MNGLVGQILRFCLVGGAATATHFVIALLLIMQASPPLWANTIAFLIAFLISFFGHRRFTFSATRTRLATAILRFAATALLAFALNTVVLLTLLEWTALPVFISLAASLGMAAIFTFVAGRFWAFSNPKAELAGSH